MKKSLLLALIACLSSLGLSAQTNYKTVTGYVVDGNGAPISGAEVAVPGGGETVYTDADGSFTLQVHPMLKKLTARYAGMSNLSLNTDFNAPMVFTMEPVKTNPGFINVMGGFGLDFEVTDYNFGTASIMGGQLGKWGYYGKFTSDFADGYALTLGAIKSLKANKSYMYFGAGWNHFNDESWEEGGNGVAVDLGLIVRPSEHFNINLGLNFAYGFRYEDKSLCLQAGVGYVF